jgi:hypothetical protein
MDQHFVTIRRFENKTFKNQTFSINCHKILKYGRESTKPLEEYRALKKRCPKIIHKRYDNQK